MEVRDMMEKIREDTEADNGVTGQKIPTVALSAQKAKMQKGEFFKDEFKLDHFLLSEADKITELMNEVEKLEDPGKPKDASLGMNKVARMLGKEFMLSGTAAQEAATEHKVALAKFDTKTPAESAPAHSSETEDLDMPDEDDAEVKERSHWAAVEALKKRAPNLAM